MLLMRREIPATVGGSRDLDMFAVLAGYFLKAFRHVEAVTVADEQDLQIIVFHSVFTRFGQ